MGGSRGGLPLVGVAVVQVEVELHVVAASVQSEEGARGLGVDG